jgi:DNA-binding transcriptional regulator YiaG
VAVYQPHQATHHHQPASPHGIPRLSCHNKTMGAAIQAFPPHRTLTDAERRAAARAALNDGTVTRIRHVMQWSEDDLARRINVRTSLVRRWEAGELIPGDYAALTLWRVLVDACTHTPEPDVSGTP